MQHSILRENECIIHAVEMETKNPKIPSEVTWLWDGEQVAREVENIGQWLQKFPCVPDRGSPIAQPRLSVSAATTEEEEAITNKQWARKLGRWLEKFPPLEKSKPVDEQKS